mgnify:CR=1 FL=1
MKEIKILKIKLQILQKNLFYHRNKTTQVISSLAKLFLFHESTAVLSNFYAVISAFKFLS